MPLFNLFHHNNGNENTPLENAADASSNKHNKCSRLGDIEAIDLEITILRGENLTPKDRSFFGLGRLTSSDPYVKVYLVQEFPQETTPEPPPQLSRLQGADGGPYTVPANATATVNSNNNNRPTGRTQLKLGRTSTVYKTLHPEWNETILGSLRGKYALQHHTAETPATLEFHILDEDQLSSSDLMGIVTLQLPLASHNLHINVDTTVQWYDVPPTSAKNASGRLQIRLKTTLRRSHILVRGNTFDLTGAAMASTRAISNSTKLQKRKQVIQLGLSWDVLPSVKETQQANANNNNNNKKNTPNPTKSNVPARSSTTTANNLKSSATDDFVSGFHPVESPTSNSSSWSPSSGKRNPKFVDLDASCVAISHQGHVIMPDTVYYGNLANSNRSVLHSGDEQQGTLEGDDESITLHLDRIPNHVLAMYIILTVATPHMTLKDVTSTQVRVLDITPLADSTPAAKAATGTARKESKKTLSRRKKMLKQQSYHPNTNSTSKNTEDPTCLSFPREQTLCVFKPSTYSDSGDATAMFLLRIARDTAGAVAGGGVSKRWILTPIEDMHPTARDFGSLMPHVKAYTRDLIPNIEIDPTERVAILRKGGNIRIEDYCRNHRLPQKVTFGLAWDVTNGQSIDLDASAICLDANLNLVDTIWWKQLHSKDYNIIHHGDEREGDEVGDDELIDLYLNNMSLMGDHCHVHYIGFVINSYTGEKLKDVDRASCHLFDPDTNIEMATYALTNAKALEGVTSLLVGFLFRSQGQPKPAMATPIGQSFQAAEAAAKEGEWCLSIIAEASNGRTVKDNVQGFQNYLKQHPPNPPRSIFDTGTQRIVDPELVRQQSEMPPFVPLADEMNFRLSQLEVNTHNMDPTGMTTAGSNYFASPQKQSIAMTPASQPYAPLSPLFAAGSTQQPLYSQYARGR